MDLLDYEKKHIDYLNENSHECCLFLNRNEEFPISSPCSVFLLGNGARNTIKGGTGSGDVVSRFFKNIEEGLKDKGFNIVSTKWLDEYDEYKKNTLKDYIRETKKLAKKAHMMASVYSMGFFEEEKNYSISLDYDADICVYVLARNSGEGNDRRNIKGDIKLSDKEVSDILYLNNKYKKFMLVLNVGGVIDLSPINEVSNILLLSQLGVVTSDVLAKILLGEVNPSGKLTTTWAKPEDYPGFMDFGNYNDTYYKEGIYVGYRYFNTVKKKVFYPFGYGKSYTDFEIKTKCVTINDMNITIDLSVTNIGKYMGKEVVQVYVTKPNTILDNPYVELCGYVKTKEIEPGMVDDVSITIDITELVSYDEDRSVSFLQKGDYIFRIGNSSLNLVPVTKCILEDEVIIDKLSNKCRDINFKDNSISRINDDLVDVKEYILNPGNVKTNVITYKKDTYIEKALEGLSKNDLAYICLGHHKFGLAAIIGSTCEHVIGGAGETVLRVKELTKSLTMADGPAGLRLKTEYGIDKKGVYDVSMDPMMEKMLLFLPKISSPFIRPPKNRHGEIHHQYTTAIPIGTALAQSFNDEFVEKCGKLVAEEMINFNVDLWLAPALNIHRNILCGRNFEYYSEDPLLSGKIATAMVKGVEANKLGCTIKHFACNNQEFNRNNNNSHLSERALREIYLKGFEICIKNSNPKSIMTSYNLINGIHTSESFELINDILRCEWGYNGLVMTDWIASGRSFGKASIYPAPYADNNILAGNDLTMSGCPKDYKIIMKSIKSGKLTKEDLLYSASRIYRSIMIQKNN